MGVYSNPYSVGFLVLHNFELVAVTVVHTKHVQSAAADFEAVVVKCTMNCTDHLSDERILLNLLVAVTLAHTKHVQSAAVDFEAVVVKCKMNCTDHFSGETTLLFDDALSARVVPVSEKAAVNDALYNDCPAQAID